MAEPAPGGTTLRRRLLRFILIPLLVSLIAAGSVSYFSARRETAEVYDKQLVLLAQVLRAVAAQNDGDEEDRRQIARYDTILAGSGDNVFSYRIWFGDSLALTSPNAASFDPDASPPGFSDRKFGGELWRVFAIRDGPNEITVEVAGQQKLRTEIIREILLSMFIPLLLVIPLIAALVWFGVIRGLTPISTLLRLIKRRDPYSLTPFTTRELPHGDVPGEIVPLVDALNSLMARMADVLDAEKQFTDHAAHELRTPLAAIRVQAQVAWRTTDNAQKQQLLDDLVRGVDRAGHLVSQLLSLARAQSQPERLLPVDLSALLHSIVGEFDAPLRARNQQLETDIPPGIEIPAIEELLAMLLRNLIDNAVKYSPPGATIRLRLARGAGRAVLSITNPGPGIPKAEQDNIFKRFYRLPGSNAVGCGLGLALVQRICEIHGAEISLTSLENGQTSFTIGFRQ